MKQMKNFTFKAVSGLCGFAALMISAMGTVSSCSNLDYESDGPLFPDGIVTVKTTDSGVSYFQLDAKTTLEPVDWKNPYKKEVRALVSYEELADASGLCSKKVKVKTIDSVLTKSAVPFDDEFRKGADDPVELVFDWLTNCEDGYLTIHFAAQWGGNNVTHYVHLGIDPENPREIYFRHDDNGDTAYSWLDGVVSFKIDDLMGDLADGEELTLHWTTFNGQKTTKTLKYYKRFSLSDSVK